VLTPLGRWRYCIPFQNASAKTGGGQIRRLQKNPPNLLVTTATSLKWSQNEWQLIIPTHMSTKAEYFVKISGTCVEIIGQICPFLPFFHQSTKMSKGFSGVTTRNLTKFVHDVATSNALLNCPFAFRYSNQFQNCSATMIFFFFWGGKRCFATLTGCHGNVPWAIAKWMQDLSSYSSTKRWKVCQAPFSNSSLCSLCRPLKNKK